jgi:hypothetical protein
MIKLLATMIGLEATPEEKRTDKMRVPERAAVRDCEPARDDGGWLVHLARANEWHATSGRYRPSSNQLLLMTHAQAQKWLLENVFTPTAIRAHRSQHINAQGDWVQGYDVLADDTLLLICVRRSDIVFTEAATTDADDGDDADDDRNNEKKLRSSIIDKQRHGYAEFDVKCQAAVPSKSAAAEAPFNYFVIMPKFSEITAEYLKVCRQLGVKPAPGVGGAEALLTVIDAEMTAK